MTRILLVRHGETEWNREERFRGRADIPLNVTGLAQADATARRLASECQSAAVYSSPLSRSRGTAEAIARHHLAVFGLECDRFWRIRQDTCASNEVEISEEQFTLVSLNDTCHLRRGPGGQKAPAQRSAGD